MQGAGCRVRGAGCRVQGDLVGVELLEEGVVHDGADREDGQHVEEHLVGGGVRIHPENAHMSGRHGVQYGVQCIASTALTLVVWQHITYRSMSMLNSTCLGNQD